MSAKGIYLGKGGRTFGPFTEKQLEQLRLSGEIEKYTYQWDEKHKTWVNLDPLPPEPGAEPAHKATDELGHTEALCHDHHALVAGLLENVTDSGCELVSHTPSDTPQLGVHSTLVLNVLDPTGKKALNVKAALSDVTHRDGAWVYQIRWARRPVFGLLLLLSLLGAAREARGEQPTPPPAPGGAGSGAEEMDVQKIKEKYWARGNETEMGVVQNRLYPKRHRIELGVMGGQVSGDPFLSIYSLGGSLGFHFSEFFALHVTAWKAFVSGSPALATLMAETKVTANTNALKFYGGAEVRASVLYGKLSLLGAAILYFDAYFSGGAGYLSTETGGNALVSLGVGQQIHLSRVTSLNLDYKVLYFNETILDKVSGANLGRRTNLSNAITLGFSIFMNPFDGDKP